MSDKASDSKPKPRKSKKEMFDKDSELLFKMYLNGASTIHEVEAMLEDLKREYYGNS